MYYLLSTAGHVQTPGPVSSRISYLSAESSSSECEVERFNFTGDDKKM